MPLTMNSLVYSQNIAMIVCIITVRLPLPHDMAMQVAVSFRSTTYYVAMGRWVG